MSIKNPSTMKETKNTRRGPSLFLIAGLLFLSLILGMGLLAYIMLMPSIRQMDAEIQQKFTVKRWLLPAVVYARPLELVLGDVHG